MDYSESKKEEKKANKLLSNEEEDCRWLRLGTSGFHTYLGGGFNHTSVWTGWYRCWGEGKRNQG